jgi:outer membrane protein assembly factor BamB
MDSWGQRGRAVRAVPLALMVSVAVIAAAHKRIQQSSRGAASASPSLGAESVSSPSASAGSRLMARAVPAVAGLGSAAARMFHGGPTHAHVSAARGPRSAAVRWTTKGLGPIAAQVVASPDESTLYAASLAGKLHALQRSDGALRYSVPLGERVYSTPLVGADGAVYLGTDGKQLVALDGERVRFRLELDGEADSGVNQLPDGTLVFAAGTTVYGVSPRGDIKFRFRAKKKIYSQPAVTPSGLVVFGSQDDHVYALRQGELVWATNVGNDVDCAPSIGTDGGIFVGTDKGEVLKLDESGSIRWRSSVGGFVRGGLTIAHNGDVLLGTYGPAPRVLRLGPGGEILGAFGVQGTGAREFGVHGSPLEDREGAVYFGAQDNAAYGIGPGGEVLFRHETGADVDAPLTLLSDGSLLVPSEDGSVTLLGP